MFIRSLGQEMYSFLRQEHIVLHLNDIDGRLEPYSVADVFNGIIIEIEHKIFDKFVGTHQI